MLASESSYCLYHPIHYRQFDYVRRESSLLFHMYFFFQQPYTKWYEYEKHEFRVDCPLLTTLFVNRANLKREGMLHAHTSELPKQDPQQLRLLCRITNNVPNDGTRKNLIFSFYLSFLHWLIEIDPLPPRLVIFILACKCRRRQAFI